MRPVGKFLVKLIFKVKYEGLENVPADKGFILIGNHRSYIDPVFVAVMLKTPLIACTHKSNDGRSPCGLLFPNPVMEALMIFGLYFFNVA